VLFLSAFPAFVVGHFVVHGFLRFGVNELTSFMPESTTMDSGPHSLQSPFPFLQGEIEFVKGVVSRGIEDHQKYRLEARCHRMDS
jgi:hypothetical protein